MNFIQFSIKYIWKLHKTGQLKELLHNKWHQFVWSNIIKVLDLIDNILDWLGNIRK